MIIFLAAAVLISMVEIPYLTGLLKFFRVPEADGVFDFMKEDDSDIKIAGAKPVKGKDDALAEASELEAQRGCGNLEKAHALGAALSEKIAGEDGESDFGQDIGEDGFIRMQRRLLLTFAAVNTVEGCIKSSVLQGVVIKVLYDTLKESLPDFYDDISESGSFSLYTLCVRRGGDVESSVGQTFATLAGKEGNAVIGEFGKALYLHFVDVTLSTVKSFNLKQ
jgi:hypothetical protein